MAIKITNTKAANQLRLPGGISIPRGGSAIVDESVLANKLVKNLIKNRRLHISTGLPGPVGTLVDGAVNEVLEHVVEDVVIPVASKVVHEVEEVIEDVAEAVSDFVTDLFDGDKPKRRKSKKADSSED